MSTINFLFDGQDPVGKAKLEQLSELLQPDDAFVWIDVDSGDPESLREVQALFGLHQLAVDSAMSLGEQSHITLYDDMIYLEFYGMQVVGENIVADDIGIFVGEKFLITVRTGDMPSVSRIRQRWADSQIRQQNGLNGSGSLQLRSSANREKPRKPSTVTLLYGILDELVDGYFTVVDWLGNAIEELEEGVIESTVREPQLAIQSLRSKLLRMRRMMASEQDILNTLLRRDVPIIPESIIPYFADVHNHVLRIYDWTEMYRDQLATIVDLQLSMQSNKLNSTMRTLTASSIILMGGSLVAGIYGMNFKHMPELEWRYGYPIALLLMIVIGLGLYRTFKHWGWWE